MTYVVSDLHGNHAAFQNLLKKINFTEDDILYIVGDIVDYGEYSMDLLCEVSMMPNVYAVVGDHVYVADGVLHHHVAVQQLIRCLSYQIDLGKAHAKVGHKVGIHYIKVKYIHVVCGPSS